MAVLLPIVRFVDMGVWVWVCPAHIHLLLSLRHPCNVLVQRDSAFLMWPLWLTELIFRLNVASKLYSIKHYCGQHNSKKCIQALLANLTIIHKMFEHHSTTGRRMLPPLGMAVAEYSLFIYSSIHPYLHSCQTMLTIK